MDANAQRRLHSDAYLDLRTRLRGLNYSQTLSLDSTALVEKLLTDLLKTTEGFQQLKSDNEQLRTQLAARQGDVGPLTSEVTRLTTQNNELHLELMRGKEENGAKTEKWRVALQRAEVESGDLKFLLEQSKAETNNWERSNCDLRDKLQELLGQGNTGERHKPHGKERLQVTSTLEAADPEVFMTSDIQWAEALRQADERLLRVNRESERAAQEKRSLARELEKAQKCIELRDREIERLSLMVAGGLGLNGILQRHELHDTKMALQTLEEKLDFFYEENRKLEGERESFKQFFDLERGNDHVGQTLQENKNQNRFLKEKIKELEGIAEQLQGPTTQERAEFTVERQQLCEQVRTLQLELKKTNGELKSAHSKAADCQREVEKQSKALQSTENHCGETAERAKELDLENQNLTVSLESAREQSGLYLSQMGHLRKELETTHSAVTRANAQHLALTESSYELRHQAATLENQKIHLTGQIESLTFDLERANKQRREAQEQFEQLKQHEFSIRTEIDSNAANNQQLNALLDASRKQIETLKEELEHAQSIREKDQEALLSFEDKLRNSYTEISIEQRRNRMLQQEHTELSNDLANKLQIIHAKEQLSAQLRNQVSELKPLKERHEKLTEHANSLQELAATAKEDYLRMAQKAQQLQGELSVKENRVQDLQDLLSIAKSEKTALQDRITELEAQVHSAVKSSIESDSHNTERHSLKMQILELREQEKNYMKEIEKLKQEIARSGDCLSSKEAQIQRSNTLQERYEEEMKSLKEQVSAIGELANTAKNEQTKSRQQNFSHKTETEDLNNQLAKEQQIRNRLEEQIKQLHATLHSEKTHITRLAEQNNQLKSLVEQLESSRNELQEKLQSDNQLKDTQKHQLLSEISSLKKDLSNKEDEVVDLRATVRKRNNQKSHEDLETDRDNLENQLKGTNSELAVTNTRLDHERQRLEDLGLLLAQGRQDDSMYEQYQQTKEEVLTLEIKVQELKQQRNDLKYKVQQAEGEINDQENQLRTRFSYR